MLNDEDKEHLLVTVQQSIFDNQAYLALSHSDAIIVLRSIMEEQVFNDNVYLLERLHMKDSVNTLRSMCRDESLDATTRSEYVKFVSSSIVNELSNRMLARKLESIREQQKISQQTPVVFSQSVNTTSQQQKTPPIPQKLVKTPLLPPPVDKDKLRSIQQQFWDKPCILIVGDSGSGKSSM
jgi:putative ribosome biogenesis GTPase RsgA